MPGTEDLGDLNTKNWEDLQGLADSLEASWNKGEPADLAALLPPPGMPVRAIILQELIKTDLECRWRHGRGADMEFYLETFAADLGPAQSLPPALIYEEYRVRHLFGDRPPLEQLKAILAVKKIYGRGKAAKTEDKAGGSLGVLPSAFTTGITSAAVPVRKHSSAMKTS